MAAAKIDFSNKNLYICFFYRVHVAYTYVQKTKYKSTPFANRVCHFTLHAVEIAGWIGFHIAFYAISKFDF